MDPEKKPDTIAFVLAWISELSFLGPCAMDQQNGLTKSMGLYIGRSATDRSLWWICEHHDCQLQLQASRATKAEASALQWLVALPPFTAPRSKVEIDVSALIF